MRGVLLEHEPPFVAAPRRGRPARRRWPASPCPRGRNRPVLGRVAAGSRRRRAPGGQRSASTSFRCTWPTRSPCRRAKATGSYPPISEVARVEAPRHARGRRACARRPRRSRPACRRAGAARAAARARRAERARHGPGPARHGGARPSSSRTRGDQAASTHDGGDEDLAAGAGQQLGAALGRCARVSLVGRGVVQHERARTRRRAAARAVERGAHGPRRRRRGSRAARARWPVRPRAAISARTRVARQLQAPARHLADAPRDGCASEPASIRSLPRHPRLRPPGGATSPRIVDPGGALAPANLSLERSNLLPFLLLSPEPCVSPVERSNALPERRAL